MDNVFITIPSIVAELPAMSAILAEGGWDRHAQMLDVVRGLLDGSSWWQPLYSAPRNGTWVLVAFAGADQQPYVAQARWVEPRATEGRALPKRKRELAEVYGGYWSRTKGGQPSKSHAIAWMHVPMPPPGRREAQPSVDQDHRARETVPVIDPAEATAP